VADQKGKVYYFDSSTSPNTFWVPRAALDRKPGAPIMKLTVAGAKIHSGNAADQFVATPSFTFMPVAVK